MPEPLDLSKATAWRKAAIPPVRRSIRSLLLVLSLWPTATGATTFVVNDPGDSNDGVCDRSHCTLREAIAAANGLVGSDEIVFALAAGTVITPATELPAIEDSVTIDGGGAVTLDGSASWDSGSVFGYAVGLYLADHEGSTIRGLVVENFLALPGIVLNGGGNHTIVRCRVANNGVFFGFSGIGVYSSSCNLIGSASNDPGDPSHSDFDPSCERPYLVRDPGDGNLLEGNGWGGLELVEKGDWGLGFPVLGDADYNVIGDNWIVNNGIAGLELDDLDPSDGVIEGTVVAHNVIGTDNAETLTDLGNGAGSSVFLYNHHQPVVRDNLVAYAGGGCIALVDAIGARAEGNIVDGCSFGFLVPSPDAVIYRNMISNIAGDGVRVYSASDRVEVRENTITNAQRGVILDFHSDDCVVANNTIRSVVDKGVLAVFGSQRAQIRGNTILGAGRNGIALLWGAGGAHIVDNLIGTDATGLDVGGGNGIEEGRPSSAGIFIGAPSMLNPSREVLGLVGLSELFGEAASAMTDVLIQGNTIAYQVHGPGILVASDPDAALTEACGDDGSLFGSFGPIDDPFFGLGPFEGTLDAWCGRNFGIALESGLPGAYPGLDFPSPDGTQDGFDDGIDGNHRAIAILDNRIYANEGLGIDLSSSAVPRDSVPFDWGIALVGTPDGVTENDAFDDDVGANGLQNHPILARNSVWNPAVLVVKGDLESTPGTHFLVQVFAGSDPGLPGSGQAEAYVGSFGVTTDDSGHAHFTKPLPHGELPATGSVTYLTATATDPAGNTSELSPAIAVERRGH